MSEVLRSVCLLQKNKRIWMDVFMLCGVWCYGRFFEEDGMILLLLLEFLRNLSCVTVLVVFR